jgi:hypothetical protein
MPGPVEEKLIYEIYGLVKERMIKENDRLLNELSERFAKDMRKLECRLDDLYRELAHMRKWNKRTNGKRRRKNRKGGPVLWV